MKMEEYGHTLANFAIGAIDLATTATLHYDKDSYSALLWTKDSFSTLSYTQHTKFQNRNWLFWTKFGQNNKCIRT